MFNKLLLVISFCAFILGKDVMMVDDAKDLPNHNPDIVYIDRHMVLDDDGILRYFDSCSVDNSYSYVDIKVPTLPPTYMAVSEENITGLKIGKERSQNELEEFSKCQGMKYLRDYQELIAYYANFIDEVDIIPSLTYQVSNGPKYYSRIVHRNGIIYRVKYEIDGNCVSNYNYFWESVYHNGVVDQSCIPEDFTRIPGYDVEYDWSSPPPQGTPEKIEKCFNGGEFNPKYKGYGKGNLRGVNITTLKEAITQYGPVYVNYAYYAKEDSAQPDGFLLYYGEYIHDLLVIGWDATGFVTIKTEQQNYGKVKGNLPFSRTDNGKEYDNIYIYSAYFITEAEEVVYKPDEIPVQEIDEEDLPDRDSEIVKLFNRNIYDDEGVQSYDYEEICSDETEDERFIDVELKVAETAETFYAIPEDMILDLKASQDLTSEQIAEINKCRHLIRYREDADLLAYTAFFVDQSDIYPSLTYLLSNGMKYRWEESNIDGKFYKSKSAINYNCEQQDLDCLSTIFKYGVIDESCIPNDFSQIPGYGWKYGDEYPYGTAQKLPNECEISGAQFDPKLKGYAFGMVTGNTTTLKKAITKYGPLDVSGYYQKKDDSEVGFHEVAYFDGMIFIGWDTDGFITVEDEEKYNTETGKLISRKKKIGKIPFVGDINQEPYDLIYFRQTSFFAPIEEVDCSDVTDKTIQECPCPTDPNLLTQDPRYDTTCKPTEVIQQPPSEEEPEITLPEITVESDTQVNVEDNKNEEANVVENGIKEALKDGNSLGVNVTKNEVYEEMTINVQQNKAYILQPKEQASADLLTPPVLRPIDTRSEGSQNPPQVTDPFISVKGNGDIEIKGFIIEHFQQITDQPLIQTEDDGILRLVNVTLSGDYHIKDKTTGVITSQQQGHQIQAPYIEAHGKKVLLDGVTVEPSNFNNCNGIVLSGSQGPNNHQFLAEKSNFNVLNQIGLSFINSKQFTVVFKDCAFRGININQNHLNTQNQREFNVGPPKTCDWNTGSVNIENSIGFFDRTTFSGLSEGALKVGGNGAVTLKDTVSFYGNTATPSDDILKGAQRNIICAGKDGLLAQLRAESSSFKEVKVDESIIQSNNRWVLSDSGTCSIFGSLNLEKLLLFTPMVQSVVAKGNEKKTGIDVDIKGSSLFGCGKLFLLVSLKQKVSKNEDEITSKKYELGSVASQWDSDTDVSASIPEDEFVKKGKKLSISVQVQTEDGLLQEVDIEQGGSNSADVSGFSGGLSVGALIGIIVAAVVVVAVIVIIIIVAAVVYKKSLSKTVRISPNDNNGTEMNENATKSVIVTL